MDSQELILAPRSLLYTSQQIIWDCHTSKFCESDENYKENEVELFYAGMERFFWTLPLARERFPEFQEFLTPLSRWYSLVSDYFYRDLTNQKDILPAISGLAREIQNWTKMTYAAGIWIEELHTALLWNTTGFAKVPEKYFAPSWSWASLESLPSGHGSVNLYHTTMLALRNADLSEWRACYLSHEVIFEDGDPFGCVSSGFIRIRGRFLPTRLWQGKSRPYYNSSLSHDFNSHDFGDLRPDQLCYSFDSIDMIFEEEDGSEEEDVEGEGSEGEGSEEENAVQTELLDETVMFQISAWNWGSDDKPLVVVFALLLLPVKDKPAGTYRRVGIVEVPNHGGPAKNGWSMKEITII